MPRRREVPKREILPDPIYNSQLVTRFVNVVMRDGKKTVAERILYDALSLIEQRVGDDPMKVFKRAVENVKPAVEVKSRRVGGSTYQNAKRRSERGMGEKLAGELLDAADQRGAAIKKREDTHRMADANKAYAHYRW
jgi:small subunit ribosomal protein S7